MVLLEKVDSGGKQWAVGQQAARGVLPLPGDLEGAASGNACSYTAEFPSPETARHLSLSSSLTLSGSRV